MCYSKDFTLNSTVGLKIIVDDIVPSTGLELKYDPGIPLVFAGT